MILSYVWAILFVSRMKGKDYSLSKKDGWEKYSQKSWMLPFKFFESTFLSSCIYGGVIGSVYYCVKNGGMEKTAKMLLYNI